MKTAIDFLADKINEEELVIFHGLFNEFVKQAKKIEKQQIIDAANQIEIIGKDHLLPGEEYYEKKYNNNDT